MRQTALWLCAWVAVGAPSLGLASTITETASIATGGLPDFPANGLDVFLPQFDASLGTLTGVAVSLTGSFIPSILVEYTASALPPAVLNSQVGVFGLGGENLSEGASFVLAHGGQVATGKPELVSIYSDPALAGYTGSGNYDFLISGATALGLYNSLGGGAIDESVLNGKLSVTYAYTPDTAVPEPASTALLLAGIITFFAARARWRA